MFLPREVRNGKYVVPEAQPSLWRFSGRLTCQEACRTGTVAAELGLSVRPALEEDSLKNLEKKKKQEIK